MFSPKELALERGWPGRIEGDRIVQLAAQTLQAFFTGGGGAREHAEYPLADCELRAPVLFPPSVRRLPPLRAAPRRRSSPSAAPSRSLGPERGAPLPRGDRASSYYGLALAAVIGADGSDRRLHAREPLDRARPRTGRARGRLRPLEELRLRPLARPAARHARRVRRRAAARARSTARSAAASTCASSSTPGRRAACPRRAQHRRCGPASSCSRPPRRRRARRSSPATSSSSRLEGVGVLRNRVGERRA